MTSGAAASSASMSATCAPTAQLPPRSPPPTPASVLRLPPPSLPAAPAARALMTPLTSSRRVVSSSDRPMWSPSTRRTLNPASRARSASASASPGTRIVMVSKYERVTTSRPTASSPAASAFVSRCTRSAIVRNRSGPWYTAYIAAITASSTWAVQMFEVAFSRRICCSRVCNAMRNAVLPCASTDTPMIRPGVWRL